MSSIFSQSGFDRLLGKLKRANDSVNLVIEQYPDNMTMVKDQNIEFIKDSPEKGEVFCLLRYITDYDEIKRVI